MDKLETELKIAKKNGLLPKIVTVVSFAGNPTNNKRLKLLSAEYEFKVVEDASHALGSFYDGKPTGSGKYSDITVFSFHPVKIITSAEGGAAVCNSLYLYEKMKVLRSHGIVRDSDKFRNTKIPHWYYEQQYLGFNYRMSELHAALGLSQIMNLQDGIIKRNKLASKYRRELLGFDISILDLSPGVDTASYHLYVLLLESRSKRDSFFKFMRNQKVGVQLHYYPLHLHDFYRRKISSNKSLPNSVDFAETAISIPLFPSMTSAQQNYVVSKIDEFFN